MSIVRRMDHFTIVTDDVDRIRAQVGKWIAERVGKGLGLVACRSAPQDDALARQMEMAGGFGF